MGFLQIIQGAFKFLGGAFGKVTEASKNLGAKALDSLSKKSDIEKAATIQAAETLKKESSTLISSTSENSIAETKADLAKQEAEFKDNLKKVSPDLVNLVHNRAASSAKESVSNVVFNIKKLAKKTGKVTLASMQVIYDTIEKSCTTEFKKVAKEADEWYKATAGNFVNLGRWAINKIRNRRTEQDQRSNDSRTKIDRIKQSSLTYNDRVKENKDSKLTTTLSYFEHEKQRKEQLKRVLLKTRPQEEHEAIELEFDNEILSLEERLELEKNTLENFASLGYQIANLNNNFIELTEELNNNINLGQSDNLDALADIQEVMLASGESLNQGQARLSQDMFETSGQQVELSGEIARLSSKQLNEIASNILDSNAENKEHLENIEDNQEKAQQEHRVFQKSVADSQNEILTASLVSAQAAQSVGSTLIEIAKSLNGNILKNRKVQQETSAQTMQNFLENGLGNQKKEDEGYKGLTGIIFQMADHLITTLVKGLEDPYGLAVQLAEGFGETVGRILCLTQMIVGNIGSALYNLSPTVGSFLQTLIPTTAKQLFGISIPDMLIFPPDEDQRKKQLQTIAIQTDMIRATISDLKAYILHGWTWLKFAVSAIYHTMKTFILGIADYLTILLQAYLKTANLIISALTYIPGVGRLLDDWPAKIEGWNNSVGNFRTKIEGEIAQFIPNMASLLPTAMNESAQIDATHKAEIKDLLSSGATAQFEAAQNAALEAKVEELSLKPSEIAIPLDMKVSVPDIENLNAETSKTANVELQQMAFQAAKNASGITYNVEHNNQSVIALDTPNFNMIGSAGQLQEPAQATGN